ncbi:MAG: hypothetical protein ACRC50_00915 [Gaiella sp.]
MPRRRLLALVATLLVALAAGAVGLRDTTPARAAEDPCVAIPTEGPLWIEYGEGSVPAAVRAVFQQPGVTVAVSGTSLPPQYRAAGARTTSFVLKLPRWVGSPVQPAEPSTMVAAADRLYDQAVRTTLCERPVIALNELAGPAASVPWTSTVRTYRANVLALVRRLAERGATPVLLVHGNPVVTGEARTWWRAVAQAGHVVYQAYYKAPNIVALGRIVGPRRMRLGMRSIVRILGSAGVPPSRLGLMLGFQVAPGKAGREGLQPSAAWFRYVKWNALAARQVAAEERLPTVWSWGWGNLSPQAADPDKPAAACVYLWARDARLCDGRAAAGPGFDASLVEGAIAIAEPHVCVSAAGKLSRRTVDELARLTRDVDEAVTAAFVRQVLRRRVPIRTDEILAAEAAVVATAFGGSRSAYLAELTRRRATPAIARGILEDALRRDRIAALAGPVGSPLAWSADLVTAAIDTATCRGDRLPGTGDFPASDRRDTAGVPLARLLPFLLADVEAPASPSGLTAGAAAGGVTLDWSDGFEPDLLGYHVFRAPKAGAAARRLTTLPIPRSAWIDRAPPTTAGAVYVVRAIDAAGNLSAPAATSATSG